MHELFNYNRKQARNRQNTNDDKVSRKAKYAFLPVRTSSERKQRLFHSLLGESEGMLCEFDRQAESNEPGAGRKPRET